MLYDGGSKIIKKLAKKFATKEDASFINGVLGKVVKEIDA